MALQILPVVSDMLEWFDEGGVPSSVAPTHGSR
jgi:hypothetical protein